jgi:hypothetical protein
MDGCVLDGARQLLQPDQADRTLNFHLGLFTDRKGSLTYEDARSRIRNREYAGIEYTLPAAEFALADPYHPSVEAAVQFWRKSGGNEGLIYTVRELGPEGDTEILKRQFILLAEETLSLQSPQSGLWSCFIDEPELAPDTSGSAGIAAALRAAEGLEPFISFDGLLSGVAQSNRGGEALQRSAYRVFSQMGSGLAAQLFGHRGKSRIV